MRTAREEELLLRRLEALDLSMDPPTAAKSDCCDECDPPGRPFDPDDPEPFAHSDAYWVHPPCDLSCKCHKKAVAV
ncbi:MAG: hypothetical protein Q8R28_02190 [Dehalococcoidia bacterium]|nr:hypothetical protein [Dehalococcoidia bacterium]